MGKSQIISILRYALVILGAAGAGMGSQLIAEPACPPCADMAPASVEPSPVSPVEVPVTPPAVGLPE